MKILIEIPRTDIKDAMEFREIHPNNVEVIVTKKFDGALDIISMVVDVTTTFGPYVLDYLIKRKKEGKKSTIKIEGIEYEYDTREELEEIIKSANEEE